MLLIELELLMNRNLYQLHKMDVLIYGHKRKKNQFIKIIIHILVG